MLGVEMMLSNMVGMKPDEIRKAVADTMNAVQAAASDMAEIKTRLVRIETLLTEGTIPNERASITNGNNNVHQ